MSHSDVTRNNPYAPDRATHDAARANDTTRFRPRERHLASTDGDAFDGREGSTVRVRQRAFSEIRAKWGLSSSMSQTRPSLRVPNAYTRFSSTHASTSAARMRMREQSREARNS